MENEEFKKIENMLHEDIREKLVETMIVSEYLQYCRAFRKNAKFAYKDVFLTAKQLQKIFESKAETALYEMIPEIFSIAKNDKEYIEWSKDQEDRCTECGFKPIKKQKCSNKHPEWKKAKKEWDKELGKDLPGEKFEHCVWKETCPNCKRTEYSSCGHDDNPEEGISE